MRSPAVNPAMVKSSPQVPGAAGQAPLAAKVVNALEAKATVRVFMGSEREALIVARAMSVDQKPGSKSSVAITTEGDCISLDFAATDWGALRAVMNSSLREVKIADEMLSV